MQIHSSVICHTTGPQPLPKRFLHLMRSRASSFKWEYPLLSLRSSSNFLRLLPRLLVTSIRPFIFPSITSFRRQFLRKIWPIQLAFRFYFNIPIKNMRKRIILPFMRSRSRAPRILSSRYYMLANRSASQTYLPPGEQPELPTGQVAGWKQKLPWSLSLRKSCQVSSTVQTTS
jgi:hypothetical protein